METKVLPARQNVNKLKRFFPDKFVNLVYNREEALLQSITVWREYKQWQKRNTLYQWLDYTASMHTLTLYWKCEFYKRWKGWHLVLKVCVSFERIFFTCTWNNYSQTWLLNVFRGHINKLMSTQQATYTRL